MNKQPSSVKRSLKNYVWRLIFIPSVIVILLISISLTLLCISQLNKYIDMRGSILAQKMAHLLHQPLLDNNLQLAQQILAASIEEPFVRATHAYIAKSNTHLHSGPQFLPAEEPAEPNMQTPVKRHAFHSIRFAHPLVGVDNQNSLGWVEIELASSPYLVVRYEAIILSLALTLLCLVIGAYFALRLYQKIVDPLEHVKETVNQLARGKLNERIREQHTSEFFGLAESINTMAASMEAAQEDMQAHIDNAIEDLRETLETIEIQNVELDMARKEALEASRVKSEFLANTSHEIRTPLNGILGFINLALKTELNEKQREYMETIRDSAQNLLTVINGILDFSKIESGKLTLDYAPLPIRKTVDEVLHMLAPDAHEKNLQLITYIEPCIPRNLLGDALRFKQVLSNLVTNAIKYSDAGNIIVDISIAQRQETQITLKVAVTDQGIGLSQEEQENLFSAFSQVDSSSSREHDGTGLGLAICKGLVERMHGEIGVVSAPEQGSTFWFTARLGIDKRQPAPSQLANLSDYRILLCGENADSLKQLEKLLREWHANTHIISAVHDCFPILREARAQDKPFDLLVLDIAPNERKIPPLLLNNLAEQLESEFNCTLVACCTPAHQRLFRTHAEQSSILFINKPIAYDALLQTLGRQLDIHIKENRDQDQEDAQRPSARVLLVDDNPANLQLASELLRGLNTEVITANNGPLAIEACQTDEFDVIFMDIQMPGMDGIEATRRIRSMESGKRRTPIIALTAHTITEQKSELLIAGMDDCISKPVNETQLAHIINRWVSLTGKKNVIVQPEEKEPLVLNKLRETQPGELGSVDIQLCLKLANNKPALARDMLQMLLNSLEQEKEQINTALAQENYVQLGELIHRLYGSCCYCGVPKLKHISGLLDKLFQAGAYDHAKDAIPALIHALDDIVHWQKDKNIDALFGLDEISEANRA
ncbi:response regulator [Cellvibrio japonicus]|nr:response regulator [Cellvibrio japonicus]